MRRQACRAGSSSRASTADDAPARHLDCAWRYGNEDEVAHGVAQSNVVSQARAWTTRMPADVASTASRLEGTSSLRASSGTMRMTLPRSRKPVIVRYRRIKTARQTKTGVRADSLDALATNYLDLYLMQCAFSTSHLISR